MSSPVELPPYLAVKCPHCHQMVYPVRYAQADNGLDSVFTAYLRCPTPGCGQTFTQVRSRVQQRARARYQYVG